MDRITIAVIIAISVVGISAIIGVLKNIYVHKKGKIKKDTPVTIMGTTVVDSKISYCGTVTFDKSIPSKTTEPVKVIVDNYRTVAQTRQECHRPQATEIKGYTFKTTYNKYNAKEKNAA